MGEMRGVNRVLVGKPEGKRPLGVPGVEGMILTLNPLTWKIW